MPDYVAGVMSGGALLLLIALLIRLIYTHLAARYVWFCAFLAAQALRTLGNVVFHGPFGAIAWVSFSIAVWISQLRMSIECLTFIFEIFPRAVELKRNIAGVTYGGSAMLALIAAAIIWHHQPPARHWMLWLFDFGWLINLYCAMIISHQWMLCKLFAWIPLGPNLRAHRRLLLIYTWSNVVLFRYSALGTAREQMIATPLSYLIAWAVLISYLVLLAPDREYTILAPQNVSRSDLAALDSSLEAERDEIRKLKRNLFGH